MNSKYISNTILASILLLAPAMMSASASTDATADIKNVTIYPNGAMVGRTATVKLKAGDNDIKIPLLTPQLDQSSVQVGIVKGDATLESVKYDVEVPNRKQISAEVKTLTKRASLLRDSLKVLESKNSVLERERNLLLKNDNIGGNEGFDAQTMQGIASYLRKDLNEIATLQYKYDRKIDDYKNELTMNEQRTNLLYEKQIDPKSCLYLKLKAAAATTCEIEIQYYVENASWMPFYEVRINKRENNLHIIQKAYVSQGSKEKWDDVDLKISQNDAKASNSKPELDRYVLWPHGRHEAISSSAPTYSRKENIKVLGVVRDDKGPLKGVLVSCGKDTKTETDESGYYELMVQEKGGEYVYYEHKKYGNVSSFLKGKNVVVNNVYINSSSSKTGKSSEDNVYQNYMLQNRLQINKPNSVDYSKLSENRTNNIPQIISQNMEFDVPGKYTIPEDGADHEIVVKDMAVDAEYNYYAVPKLSKDVYLVAAIPNWKKLDLIDGSAKLFLNNMYMGESFVNAYQTEDTLQLSIGKDKDLAVERKDIKTYRSTNLTKSSKKVEHEWQITVKNNKSETVKITVEDQFPVSTNSDIKVELLDNGGATVDETDGKLTWKLTLKAGEKKDIKFSYSVKSKNDIFVE